MNRKNLQYRGRILLLSAALLFLWVLQAQAAIEGLTGLTTFDFTAQTDHISTGEGGSVLIWGYANNGGTTQYPGPTLIVNQGDAITINLTNQLAVPTSIVFPGQYNVATLGGVAGALTQEAPASGGTVSYMFTVSEPGTYTYYSGTNTDLQVEMGLLGVIVVRPTGFNPAAPQAYGHADSAYDRETLFLLTEMDPAIHQLVEFGLTAQVDTSTFKTYYWFINGRTGPDTMLGNNLAYLPTQPYNSLPRIHPGETLLIRLIGGGRDLHPFHTHGNNFIQIARDGRMLSSVPGSSGADRGVSDFTMAVSPGATYDALFSWTGEKLGWDMYGHTPANGVVCDDTVNNETGGSTPDGFDDVTYEYCADHERPIPVALPGILDMTFGAQYSGSPYLGGGGFLPPGEGGFNANGGFFYMWHSHNEKEMVNFDVFPGGMMTMMIVEPPSAPIVE